MARENGDSVDICYGWTCKNATTIFPTGCKGNQKGWSEGFGKLLVCILFYEKTKCRREGRVMSPQTLIALYWLLFSKADIN